MLSSVFIGISEHILSIYIQKLQDYSFLEYKIFIYTVLNQGINDFMRGHQPRSNLVKDENGDLLANSHNILNRLLNVHRVSDVRQIEIHTAEPLVPDPSPFEVEIAIAKLKSYKSPGSNESPAELI
jgi:hypothetical protein